MIKRESTKWELISKIPRRGKKQGKKNKGSFSKSKRGQTSFSIKITFTILSYSIYFIYTACYYRYKYKVSKSIERRI